MTKSVTFKELLQKDYVKVYSSQKKNVIDYLKQGATYYPQWSESAACSSRRGESIRLASERAYLWLKDQFEKRLHRAVNSFFWVAFDKRLLANLKDDVLILHIPITELLILSYNAWEGVLRGNQWNKEYSMWAEVNENPPSEYTKRSWEVVFEVASDAPLHYLQAVVDRVEPNWVKGVIDSQG